MTTLAMIGWQEIVVIGVVAVIIFGRRLPEVGRSLGQSLMEFKKGLKGVKGVQEAVDEADAEVEAQAESESEGREKKG